MGKILPGVIDYAPLTVVTWSPVNKGPDVTLSGGNLSGAISLAGASECVLCTVGKSTGMWYWENLVVSGGGATAFAMGIGSAATSLVHAVGFDALSWAYTDFTIVPNNGYLNHNNALSAFGPTYGPGDVMGLALDMVLFQLSVLKNNTPLGVIATGLTGTMFPAIGSYAGTPCSWTTHFAAASFTFAPPAGFIALTP